jgi:outer membrane lipoprotein-sorting protein
MPSRLLQMVAACMLLPCFQGTAGAQQGPKTADQVIARYRDAIGATRFPAITTFVEGGEVQSATTDPYLVHLGQITGHGRYEYYFKHPNLRFTSTIGDNNVVMVLHGCDGKISWHIDALLRRKEFTPKPGEEHDCEHGFELLPLSLRQPNSKIRLVGQKKVDGRMAWGVKVDDPKSHGSETFYFEAETFLLLRFIWRTVTVTYSDYRDVGEIKLPFTVVHEDGNTRTTVTLRQVQINVPIDDARFAEPQLINGKLPTNAISSPATNETNAVQISAPKTAEVSAAASAVTEVNFPNFATCTLAALQSIVPELRGLKPAADQEELQPLLEKIGTKLFDTARSTPNLISHETVTDSPNRGADTRRDYDYLILTQIEGSDVVLNEFRVDVKTGEKFRTDDAKEGPSNASEAILPQSTRPGNQPAHGEAGKHPFSQGFATSWVHFYPRNQSQSTFRYLGEQKVDRRHAVVLAFAQRPQAVHSPGLFFYRGRTVPMYFQGVAWFDSSDFRILRLRTDLLSPLAGVSLDQLTADIQFVETRIPDVSSALFLPHDVAVTSVVNGVTVRERHSYSDYRLFRARSKILLEP